MVRYVKKYAFIILSAFLINMSLLYAFPLIEYFRSFQKEKKPKLIKISLNSTLKIKKQKPKKKKKIIQPKKLMKSKSQKSNDRFKMKFGSGMGGSGATVLGNADQEIKGAVYKAGQVDQEPVLIRKVLPEVPMEAQNAGVKGKVLLKIVISESGQVVRATFESGAEGYGFKESAMEAVRQWQFKPAMVNGVPVKFEYLVPFSF